MQIPGSRLVLKIERPAYGGLFIARHDGKVVMVKGALLPGETAEVTIESEKKDYISASAIKILKPSPERIEPPCPFFGSCGGCQFQHIPYKHQIGIKQDILRDTLRRMAKIDPELSEPLYEENPWNYRLRGQFKVSGKKAGFYREGTRDIVDLDRCPLMSEDINLYFRKVRGLLTDLNIKEFHLTGYGGEVLALIKVQEGSVSRSVRKKLSTVFLEAGFSGIAIESAKKPTYQYKKGFVTLDLEGLKYTISPMSFFQSHWTLNQAVVRVLKKSLGPLKGKKVLDLYSGAGNFSMPLADKAEVTAVEENPYAIKDGMRNLELNNIRSCRFVHSSAERFKLKDHYDILILDPPRPGVTRKVMDKVLYRQPDRIVYISCNPSTFARDLKKLLDKYEIESIRLIDFFPQTFHIESLAFLRKK